MRLTTTPGPKAGTSGARQHCVLTMRATGPARSRFGLKVKFPCGERKLR